ncbi:MAG: phosphoserine transaminase [Smithellaceae bacterium]|nr:phosphoserine transaminase [Smithellaceae bacterium]
MHCPNFSSGPCAKRPGWSLAALQDAPMGRSHRSAPGRKKLAEAIELTRDTLGIPPDYLLGIMPGSDTGAFEAAMWSLLGPRPVTVLVWESFGEGWASDVAKELKLNPHIRKAPYGEIPDLNDLDWSSDVVFLANGTTGGTRVPGWGWIPDNRAGLSLCDATSAVFAMHMDWPKLDVVTFSWQKCLGGEGSHGMLLLSPRAVARLESYDPPWPLPKIFRIKKAGKVDRAIFQGDTINTPSMLCVEDYLDALRWAAKEGLTGLIARSQANLKVVEDWVRENPWVCFLAREKAIRSSTSVCLQVVNDKLRGLSLQDQEDFLKSISSELSKSGVAHDIASYRDAPPGFRFWCGPTIDQADVGRALCELGKVYNRKIGEL